MESDRTQLLHKNEAISSYYSRIRFDSHFICKPLAIEDYVIQTMPEVSPPKWHLAHTSWFFETLLLKPYLENYKEYNPKFAVLFNSYYDTIGSYHPRHQRGLLSRPTVEDVYQYRSYVDDAMGDLLSNIQHEEYDEILSRTTLGLNHEQQHQELLLTDIKHIFATNPLKPLYKNRPENKQHAINKNMDKSIVEWINFDGGIKTIGFTGSEFAYDNEEPQHKVYLEDFQIASRPVSNGQYLEFINAGSYQQCDLWLSDAWKIIKEQNWQAPLYWEKVDNQWFTYTLTSASSSMLPVNENSPVCHVSYFEAAAYTRWANTKYPGARLATENEWEVAAKDLQISGNFRDSGELNPLAPGQNKNSLKLNKLEQMYGDVWEWTQTAYTAYPGYHAVTGPLGEYNGKFMSSQMVLRGGSCVTPSDHIRVTYRNFFYPHERWQFSGFRLARDSV